MADRIIKGSFRFSPVVFITYWNVCTILVAFLYASLAWADQNISILGIYFLLTCILILSHLALNSIFGTQNLDFSISVVSLIRFSKRIVFFYTLMLVPLALQMLPLIIGGNLSVLEIRFARFENLLFGNVVVSAMHNYFLMVSSFLSAFACALLMSFRLGLRFSFYIVLLLVFESIITFGRFPIFKLILIVVVLNLVISGSRLKLREILFLFGTAMILSTFVIFYRLGEPENVVDVILLSFGQVVEYLIVGFFIFQSHLNDAGSFLHDEHSYGRSMLGIFDAAYVYVLSQLSIAETVVSGRNGGALREFIWFATTTDGQKLYGNAFGTWLSTAYRDGGWFLVWVSPFFYACFFRVLRLAHVSSTSHFLTALFLCCIGSLSLFHSPIEAFSIIFILCAPVFFKLMCSKLR